MSVDGQNISVDSIVLFYRNADTGCYKEKLYKGMKEYDSWLVDTFPQHAKLWNGSMLTPMFSPSNIDIREYDDIHFVALNYYDMANYSEKDNIYDHIILDSTRCFLFVPLDHKGKPMGITEMVDHYTYDSFTDKGNIDHRFLRHFYKHLKSVLKISKKQNAEALVALLTIGSKYNDIGFVKDGRIFFCWPNPVDINEVVQQDLKEGKCELIRGRDHIILPEYRDQISNECVDSIKKLKTGRTKEAKLRICN
jgi:hypothetical protein